MVSVKALVLTVMVSAVTAQSSFSCWCGPNQGTTRDACNKMADSGRMEGGRCTVSESRAKDYFINTACTYGPGNEWCDVKQ
ncbi:uncharacterized protein CTRU02_211633 [Colletotrichum truncatum]|uniref:Uncharacterized protein n=1 Tax=Colletotrichum truncatum TaxID=5467 RepID=A0ACC3YL85_COLTU|nr:uncharacterized protein CTRU02_14621 [Colletotrichum truncatum]KAF6781940.1 hypothetical protein CTRU02_14621 [Colletotrichum truncatum]